MGVKQFQSAINLPPSFCPHRFAPIVLPPSFCQCPHFTCCMRPPVSCPITFSPTSASTEPQRNAEDLKRASQRYFCDSHGSS